MAPLYQNCSDGDNGGDVPPTDLPPKIDIKMQNGKGTVISNGGDLCTGADNEEQSRSVVLSITTSPLTEIYYCRRPSLDNSAWNCNEERRLVSGGSEGVFRVLDASVHSDTVVELSYESLSDGHYELEISAEGGRDGENHWTTSTVSVSFVVKDCMIATCADTDPSKSSPQPFVCTGDSVYNQSAAKSTNPSDSVCCECRSGYVGTPPNCRCPSGKEKYGNSCVNECRADQERNSEGQCTCPPGQIEQGGQCRPPTRTCSDADGDGVTGDWYDCRELHGFGNNFSNGHLSISRENCCLARTCSDINADGRRGDWYACDRLHGLRNNFSNGHLSMSRGNCCQGIICEGYNCSQHNSPSWAYTLKNPLPTSGTNTKANCCDGRLKGTCGDADLAKSGNQPYNCSKHGWIYKSSSSQSRNPSRDRCCTPPAQ